MQNYRGGKYPAINIPKHILWEWLVKNSLLNAAYIIPTLGFIVKITILKILRHFAVKKLI